MSQPHGTITPARPENPANPETSPQEGQYEITVPSWSDKLVGEVVRLLLEAYYEPRFSDQSHGFRKGRGCHTALREIRDFWKGTTWFIEGDISDCFGSLDHEVMAAILAEKIRDQRFLRLIRNMLRAGYLEDWEYHDTLSGCPQGGVVSPVLSNIYLNKLDEFAREGTDPAIHAGSRPGAQSRIHEDTAPARESAAARGPGSGPGPAPPDAHAPLTRPDGPRIPAAALLKVRR
jgi:Reverse transcriptase (RNA-dependent DNA polymerase)